MRVQCGMRRSRSLARSCVLAASRLHPWRSPARSVPVPGPESSTTHTTNKRRTEALAGCAGAPVVLRVADGDVRLSESLYTLDRRRG